MGFERAEALHSAFLRDPQAFVQWGVFLIGSGKQQAHGCPAPRRAVRLSEEQGKQRRNFWEHFVQSVSLSRFNRPADGNCRQNGRVEK